MVFAYLFLVGLYESTAIPVAALLSVTVGLFGAVAALFISGLDNNIFAQIGIVVLIALAAKNAILIIEFAMAERASGKDIVTAATTAAGLRFRAVMMTSFAFILGLVPLVIASGAGAATQRAVGTAVFGGMIAASFLGIFVIPGLYVAFQTVREKMKGMRQEGRDPAAPSRRHSPMSRLTPAASCDVTRCRRQRFEAARHAARLAWSAAPSTSADASALSLGVQRAAMAVDAGRRDAVPRRLRPAPDSAMSRQSGNASIAWRRTASARRRRCLASGIADRRT